MRNADCTYVNQNSRTTDMSGCFGKKADFATG